VAFRWCYIVESVDRTGLIQRSTFLFPADAKAFALRQREAGFQVHGPYQRRVKAFGQTTPMRPGFGRRLP
jgi:hypothetical protein